MKHGSDVENYKGNLDELAKDIANLKYDALVKFLKSLSNKLMEDAMCDLKRGRKNLSGNLLDASCSIEDAKNSIENAWEISEPFMKDEK
jgi:hypothetical protein